MTIGPVSEIDLAEAREEAKDVLHDMRRGIDPKRKPAPVVTLRHVLESYLKATDFDRSHARPTGAPSRRISSLGSTAR